MFFKILPGSVKSRGVTLQESVQSNIRCTEYLTIWIHPCKYTLAWCILTNNFVNSGQPTKVQELQVCTEMKSQEISLLQIRH